MLTRLSGIGTTSSTHSLRHNEPKRPRSYSSLLPLKIPCPKTNAGKIDDNRVRIDPELTSCYKTAALHLLIKENKTATEAWFDAAKAHCLETLELLLHSGMIKDINACDHDGKNAFSHAMPVESSLDPINEELVLFLLKNGAKIDDWPLMHIACIRSSAAFIKELHREYGCALDKAGWKGRTPLHIACEFGNTEAVEYLLESGVKVDIEDSNGYPPVYGLFIETNQKKSQTLELLLNNGLSPNKLVKEIPLLFYAIYFEEECLVEKLIEHSVDVHVQYGNVTPLYAALELKQFDILNLLVTKAAASIEPPTEVEENILKRLFHGCSPEEREKLQKIIPESCEWFFKPDTKSE